MRRRIVLCLENIRRFTGVCVRVSICLRLKESSISAIARTLFCDLSKSAGYLYRRLRLYRRLEQSVPGSKNRPSSIAQAFVATRFLHFFIFYF